MVHLEEAFGDDALHRLDIRFVYQVKDPGWDATIATLLSNPHQQLISTIELD